MSFHLDTLSWQSFITLKANKQLSLSSFSALLSLWILNGKLILYNENTESITGTRGQDSHLLFQNYEKNISYPSEYKSKMDFLKQLFGIERVILWWDIYIYIISYYRIIKLQIIAEGYKCNFSQFWKKKEGGYPVELITIVGRNTIYL